MGTVAFLLGDGKYGVFEILKHISPGIVSDLFVLVLIRGGASPGALAWCTLGGTMGAARFSTIVGITALVQAPAVAYAILLPGLAVHTTFGFLSGYATYKVVQSTRQLRDAWNRRNDLPSDHRSPSTSAENTTNSSTKSRETSS
jgi:hypothetical protein